MLPWTPATASSVRCLHPPPSSQSPPQAASRTLTPYPGPERHERMLQIYLPTNCTPHSPSHIISGIPEHPESPTDALRVHQPLIRKPCLGLGRGSLTLSEPLSSRSLPHTQHRCQRSELGWVRALPSLEAKAPPESPPSRHW